MSGLDVGVRPSAQPLPQAELPGPQEAIEFFADVESEDGTAAAEAGTSPIDVILDQLSFRMGILFRIAQLEVIDVTQPVREGDERDFWLWPQGFPHWRFAHSVAFGHVAVEQGINLRPTYSAIAGRPARALDWYLKAVNSPFEVDQFMFLWIALEVLFDSDAEARVEGPYTAPCGHSIPTCPQCARPTTRLVRRRSLVAYLVRFGATLDDAEALWKTRQMMHGARSLTRATLAELPREVQVLRRAVVPALKEHLGVPADEAPLVSPVDAPTVVPQIGLGGTRVVAGKDLTW